MLVINGLEHGKVMLYLVLIAYLRATAFFWFVSTYLRTYLLRGPINCLLDNRSFLPNSRHISSDYHRDLFNVHPKVPRYMLSFGGSPELVPSWPHNTKYLRDTSSS